jgi:hypothetical protein
MWCLLRVSLGVAWRRLWRHFVYGMSSSTPVALGGTNVKICCSWLFQSATWRRWLVHECRSRRDTGELDDFYKASECPGGEVEAVSNLWKLLIKWYDALLSTSSSNLLKSKASICRGESRMSIYLRRYYLYSITISHCLCNELFAWVFDDVEGRCGKLKWRLRLAKSSTPSKWKEQRQTTWLPQSYAPYSYLEKT